MSLYPAAKQLLLPENATAKMIEPTQIILHTAVDAPGPTSLFPYFARHDVSLESHFFIRLNGVVEQYMDTNRRADANNKVNDRAISVETEDDGKPEETPWSPAQLTSMKALMEWTFNAHPLTSRQVCPSWDQPGVGYHAMWGAPSAWTNVPGKTCPGAVRIDQFNDVIVPWLEQSDVAVETEEESDMRMFQNSSNGAVLLVTGGAAVLIVNNTELQAHLEAGIPLLTVGPVQFKRYEALRVSGG